MKKVHSFFPSSSRFKQPAATDYLFRLSSLETGSVVWTYRRPFVTSFGKKAVTHNLMVTVRLSGGAVGRAEASTSLAMAWQTPRVMSKSLGRLYGFFRGKDIRDLEGITARAWDLEGAVPTAVAAFEISLWDALTGSYGISLFDLWGGVSRRLNTLCTLSIDTPGNLREAVREAVRRGFKILKIKLNGREANRLNEARLRTAHRAAPRVRFIVDANQSYTPAGLKVLLEKTRRDGVIVEAVEEPFPRRNWNMLASFRRRSRVPVILDESIQSPEDARHVVSNSLADGVNVKLAKSGILRTMEILRIVRASPRPYRFMIGCMAESALGLSPSVHLAGGLGIFDYVDLDSDVLLESAPFGNYRRRGSQIIVTRERTSLEVN